jgi:outer membrane protein OmpA-like peptidoglycan-associated protein
MKKILLSLFMGSIAMNSFSQKDNPDCLEKTFKFFTAIDGFYLTDNCKYSEFGSYDFTVDRGARSIKKEGVYREVWFRKKEDNNRTVSGLQILQNHVNAIKAVGGEVVKESDGSVLKTTYNGKELWIYVNSNTYSTDLDNYGIISIEVDVMKQEVSAQDIKGTIGSQGKIALYGILFDTGKSDIKPESEKTISSVAAYLKENPEVNVYIVGHTDNVGEYAMNQNLSKSRGEAVKNYLVSKYGISATRLAGDGVGSVCPVTSNDTEEGRTLNRRVEIVKE